MDLFDDSPSVKKFETLEDIGYITYYLAQRLILFCEKNLFNGKLKK